MSKNEIKVITEEKLLSVGFKLIPNLSDKSKNTYYRNEGNITQFFIFENEEMTENFWLDKHQMEAVKTAWEMDAWSKIY